MSHLHRNRFIPCNKAATHVCHACQLGKHVRLPFTRSTSISVAPFQLIHCDLWTSPVLSNSGFKYFLIIVDDFSHFIGLFPCATSPIPPTHLFPLSPLLARSFLYLSLPCKLTMEPNSSTPLSPPSLTLMACVYACPAPIHPPRMVKPSVLYGLSMTSLGLSFFSPLCHHLTGPRLSPLRPISSTCDPPNPLTSPFPTTAYTTPIPTIVVYACLAVCA
jgi:hypothetical protein